MKTKIAWMIVCLFLRASGCQRQSNEAIYIEDFEINHFLDPATGETDGSALDHWDVSSDGEIIHSVAGGVVIKLGVPLSGVLFFVRPIESWDTWGDYCGRNLWERCTGESGSIVIKPDDGADTIEIDDKTFWCGRTKKGKLWIFPTVFEWTSDRRTDTYVVFEVILPRRNGLSITKHFTVNFARVKHADADNAAENSNVILGRARNPQQQQGDYEPYDYLWRTCIEPPPTEPMPERLRPYEYDPPDFNDFRWSWQQLQCQTNGWQWERSLSNKILCLPYFIGAESLGTCASTCEPFVLFVRGEGLKDDIQTRIAGLSLTLYWLGSDMYCSDYLVPVADKADQGVCYDKWGNKCIAIKYPLETGIEDFVHSWLGVIGESNYDPACDLWPDGRIDWLDYAELERKTK